MVLVTPTTATSVHAITAVTPTTVTSVRAV
ncbi:hypothetical protein NGA_0556700, partial [Nannochloropsis gaditana CCMP526]